jgi:hypothetical protein
MTDKALAAASGTTLDRRVFRPDANATGGGPAPAVHARLDGMPVHRPWLDVDPWRWTDQDTPEDPTVYVPCTVHLTLSYEPDSVSGQVMSCTLRDWEFRINPVLCSPRPEQIAVGRIEVRPVPDDWFALRARYPWAYRPWRAYEARTAWLRTEEGVPVDEIARRLGRPPGHVTVKAARVRAWLAGTRGVLPPPLESFDDERFGAAPPTVAAQPSPTPADARDVPWWDEDVTDDPTVYVRLLLVLRRRDEPAPRSVPVSSVRLDPETLEYERAGRREHGWERVEDLAAATVLIRPFPPDQHELRERFPAAYAPWRPEDALDVLHWGRVPGRPLTPLIERLGRPRDHLDTKYERLESLAAANRRRGPRAEPAPYERYPARVDGEYLVWVFVEAAPRDVAARHGIPAETVGNTWFAARLDDGRLAALRADPDVQEVSDNARITLR